MEITPLTAEDIDAYLALANVNLDPLRMAVSHDATLAGLLDTPLMLCVASLAYKGRNVEVGLMRGSRSERQRHLWHSYLSTMANRRRNPQYKYTGSRQFPPEKTVAYLEFLACAAINNRVFQFNKLNLTRMWLPHNWRKMLEALMVCRVIAIAVLIGWLSQSLGPPNETDLLASISVVVGLVTAAVAWVILEVTKLGPEGKFVGAAAAGLVFLLGGFFPAALFGARNTPEGTVLFVLIGGVFSGFVLISVSWWGPGEVGEKDRIRHTVLGIFIVRVLTLSVCVATSVYCLSIAHSQHAVLVRRIVTVDQSGCMAFAIVAVFFAAESVIDHYSTRIAFAVTGFFPLRVGSFLRHAEERILLRRIGSRYSLLHLELRDYLAYISIVRGKMPGRPAGSFQQWHGQSGTRRGKHSAIP